MKNFYKSLILGLFVSGTSFLRAFPEFSDSYVFDNHYHNVVYDVPQKGYYNPLKSIWDGSADRKMFRKIRNTLVKEVNSAYWFELSRIINEVQANFFKTSMPLKISVQDEITSLPNEIGEVFKWNNLHEIPAMLALTLYLISFLTDEDLTEMENANIPLKTSVKDILGDQYDQMLDGFFVIENARKD
ncbi:MAG: hypothetical protein LBE99_02875 [Puniceicoccales bacterium]|jgi:hypothetical protein|nr:hypothetical protein [Puniceicoccales bacterium]